MLLLGMDDRTDVDINQLWGIGGIYSRTMPRNTTNIKAPGLRMHCLFIICRRTHIMKQVIS